MIAIFRLLVVVQALLTAVLWLLPYFDYQWLSIEELLVLEDSGTGAVFTSGNFIAWGIFTIWMALSLGLYFFVRLAREAFVVFYLVNFGLTLFMGIQVLTPLDQVVLGLLQVGDGMLIAIAYFTSVSQKFRTSS
ncbi:MULTISPECIES: hypothetical protein [Marinobacter]|jgi:hypothetical protein|uniref:hypothetical protein n=1 Tax=Marinobacter TaxID=2742 RepID=UPI001108038E|nr:MULTISPECIES: hypothetical protein [Marinobacter]